MIMWEVFNNRNGSTVAVFRDEQDAIFFVNHNPSDVSLDYDELTAERSQKILELVVP